MADVPNINALFGKYFDLTKYRNLHWTGSFEEYLQLVKKTPDVARNAFQRMFDMILSWGTEEYSRHKESMIHYKFFDDPTGPWRRRMRRSLP